MGKVPGFAAAALLEAGEHELCAHGAVAEERAGGESLEEGLFHLGCVGDRAGEGEAAGDGPRKREATAGRHCARGRNGRGLSRAWVFIWIPTRIFGAGRGQSGG